jgi:hypothetical protein
LSLWRVRRNRPRPERAIVGGRYSLTFAIKVALDKYLDHRFRHVPILGGEPCSSMAYGHGSHWT